MAGSGDRLSSRRGSAIVAMAVGLAVLGCAPAGEEPAAPGSAVEAAALERARAASAELGKRLTAELAARLVAGTPAAAIDVCSRIAPTAAADLSRDGLAIRRTSVRYRNPDNAPDPWERGWLERLGQQIAAGEPPSEVHEIDRAAGELRFLRPIVVAPDCLKCHGAESELDPVVRERLGQLYPEDRATGFAAGDLRGVFSVRVELGSAGPG